jgi:flagellar hook-basal body complex protein FliE
VTFINPVTTGASPFVSSMPKAFSLPAEGINGKNGGQVFGQLLQSLNETARQPDQMMYDTMVTGRVDVHELMVANAKAELALTVTTQVATKVIQAWDKIIQIQV